MSLFGMSGKLLLTITILCDNYYLFFSWYCSFILKVFKYVNIVKIKKHKEFIVWNIFNKFSIFVMQCDN